MKSSHLILLFILTHISLISQQEQMELEGAITIDDSNSDTPEPGTIRWTGSDFEGWNGVMWVSLTGNAQVGAVTDREGNIYKTIRIGEQEWMAENLRVTRTNDDFDFIPDIISDTGWEAAFFSGRCRLENSSTSVEGYGYLYNHYAVSDNICPSGWKVPTVDNWTTMIDYLGGDFIAGGKMKETGGSIHWFFAFPGDEGSNESGWSARGGGKRNDDGNYTGRTTSGYWWTSTLSSGSTAKRFQISNAGSSISLPFDRSRNYGYSVRCVKK